jgi:ABC-type transport system substrate-binding protein
MTTNRTWLPAYSRSRITRRKFIGGAAAGVGAAALIACGGGDGGGPTIAIDPSGVRKPGNVIYDKDSWQLADETKQAVAGGTYRYQTGDDLTELMDPHLAGQGAGDEFTDQGYEYLVVDNVGPGIDPQSPDGLTMRQALAEDYEVSNDALTYTFTLRRGVKFHPIAPVNGREMNIDDWKTTMEYMSKAGLNAPVWNDVVDKIDYPDNRHMVIRLKEPYAPFLVRLEEYNFAPKITPRELNLKPELMATSMIGTNFRMLDKIQPSIGWELKRFDDYWQGKPFIDRWHVAVIPEAANRHAQFIAKNIASFSPGARDALSARRDVPEALMIGSTINRDVANRCLFGKDQAQTSPWKDPRVRIALHKLMNWDALLDLDSNRVELKAAGIDVETTYQTHVPDKPIYFLDPRKNELGDASKNYFYDVAEAKRLIAAAGFPDGFEMNFVVRTSNNTTIVHRDHLNASGIVRLKEEQVTQLDYSTRIVYGAEHRGLVVSAISGSAPDVDYLLFRNYHSRGPAATYPEPKLDEIIDKSRREMDPIKRADHIKEFQRYVSSTFNNLPGAHRAGGWRFEWPWMHNVNQVKGSRNDTLGNFSYLNWLDEAMPRRNG